MSQTKRTSKGKRPSKAVSVLGIAGASLAASTSGSVADIPVADIPSQNTVPFQVFLGEEEISDVSLATFHVFDKENLGTPRSGIQLARGGCGCGAAAAAADMVAAAAAEAAAALAAAAAASGTAAEGCGRGCGGRGCGWGGCGGCGWGWGWGGCCLSWGGCSPWC